MNLLSLNRLLMEVDAFTPPAMSELGAPVAPALGIPLPIGASSSFASLLLQDDAKQRSIEDRLINARLGAIASLFRSLRLKHPPTAKHCLRVALGCSNFCGHLNLDPHLRSQIEIAALLHDIGKIGVPDHILNKSGRLDPDEAEVMQRHLTFAVNILESCCGDPHVLDIVRYSSTWYDASYPRGAEVSGESIPLGSRILSIQNAFDSMTTDLVYRRALPREQAMAELIACSATQFDPQLVVAFGEIDNPTDGSVRQSEVVRRWVEMSGEGSDAFWALVSPLTKSVTDAKTMFQQKLLESMHDGVVFVDLAGRIMVWNRGVEELTGLSKESVHHKHWQPQIVDLRDLDGNATKSKTCPLLECLRGLSEGVHRMTLTNRGSRVRTAVDVHVMSVRDQAGISHGAIMILHDVSPEQNLEERVQNLHKRATKDALTGVGNRAEFDRRHADLVATHSESGAPLSLVITDIDRFKLINDTYGHQAGDEALVAFASLIDGHSRNDDLVARYGGEEFVLLCPDCTNDAAARRAEDIRRNLAGTVQPALNNSKMTASFGVTELQAGDTPETMLKRADRALYQAKRDGRNRVVQLGTGVSKKTKESDYRGGSWFSWGRTVEKRVLERVMKSNVPLEVVAEKVRGFVVDNEAQIISAKEDFVALKFDERSLPAQRRQSDRPAVLTMNLKLDADEAVGTLIEVEIMTKRGRDRRLDDAAEQAERLFQSLKSYLIADDHVRE